MTQQPHQYPLPLGRRRTDPFGHPRDRLESDRRKIALTILARRQAEAARRREQEGSAER